MQIYANFSEISLDGKKKIKGFLLVNLQTKETNDPDWPLLSVLDFIKHSDVI